MALISDSTLARHMRRIEQMKKRGDTEFSILQYKWDLVISLVQTIETAGPEVDAEELRKRASQAMRVVRLPQ